MENLSPDLKYTLAENLSGKDLINLCSTNSNMRKICSSSKYNKIWQDKLKKEYNENYKGKNAYMRYLTNTYLYNQTYWVAIVEEVGSILDSFLFKTEDEAIQYIAERIQEDINKFEQSSFPETEAQLKTVGFIYFTNLKYSISKTHFKNESTRYKELYESKLKEIGNLLINEFDSVENFITKFKKLLRNHALNVEEDQIDSDEFLKELGYEYTEEVKEMIENLLYDPEYIFK